MVAGWRAYLVARSADNPCCQVEEYPAEIAAGSGSGAIHDSSDSEVAPRAKQRSEAADYMPQPPPHRGWG